MEGFADAHSSNICDGEDGSYYCALDCIDKGFKYGECGADPTKGPSFYCACTNH